MRNMSALLCFVLFCSCVQKLIDEPNNLISEEKLTDILYDMAILNAAKNTNPTILRDYDIDPMPFLFSKYEIDSIQFVESNRYYASLPDKYEHIYTTVYEKIKSESTRMAAAKKIMDSLKMAEQKEIHKGVKGYVKKNNTNDSLQ